MTKNNEHTRTALSVLTAWVTEGQAFALRYGFEQWANERGNLDAEGAIDMLRGHMRLSAILLQTLAEVTGRSPVEVLREAGKELAE